MTLSDDTLRLFSDLPRPPYERVRELLRRLALLSAGIALLSAVSSPVGASSLALAIVAIVGLAIVWHFGRTRSEWSITEQAVDGALIFLLVSVSATPTATLPAIYGGLSLRAFSRHRSSSSTAVAVYLIAFLAALFVRHGAVDRSVIDDIAIVLPGVPFCAMMLYALGRALTGQERAESRVRESEAYLRSLVNEAPIGIIALRNDDAVTLWNPCAERMFGWSSADVIGRTLPTIPGETADAFAALRERDRLGERQHQVELNLMRADGTPLEVLLSTAPLHNSAGEIHGTIGLVADLSDRKALEAQLRQSQKMEAVGQLAGGIAHDFNNLLTVIIAHAGFLRDEIAEGALGESIGEIEDAATRAAALTRQLLAFSRKQVLKPVVLVLSDSVVKLTGMLQRVLGEDIAIVTKLSDEPTSVLADVGQIEQVVMNLVVNARDAMPFGGSLEIETSVIHHAHQSLESVNGRIPLGSYAVLSVRDTGTGMSSEVQARIFEPFFTTKDLGRGTGLGLSTVFGIVSQSNGYLSIESSPGNGSTFTMYLPLQAACDSAEHMRTPIRAIRAQGNETVLLAEDSDQLRDLTTRVLERQGYRVLAARDGVEALEIAANFPDRIDLVLTDAVMPRVGGGELVHALRTIRDDFRVLYMTGYTDDELVRRGLGEGEDELLHKPFTPAALTSIVRRVLGSPHGAAA